MTKTTGTILYGGNIKADKRINRRYMLNSSGIATKKRMLWRRSERVSFAENSYFYDGCAAWNLLDVPTKALWETAAIECAMSGFNLFLQDKIYRIKNSIAGNATPNNLHQYKVCQLVVPEAAGLFRFWLTGNHVFASGLSLAYNFKTDLTAEAGVGEYLKVELYYKYTSGGSSYTQSIYNALSLNRAWVASSLSLSYSAADTGIWIIEIEGYKVYGTINFDNIELTDGTELINIDPFCNQFEKNWQPVILPAGVTFESVYPAD